LKVGINEKEVVWIDMDKKYWVNDKIGETVFERPLPAEIKNRLMQYSQLISDKKECQTLLKTEVDNFLSPRKWRCYRINPLGG